MSECTFRPRVIKAGRTPTYQPQLSEPSSKKKDEYIPFRDRDDDPTGFTFSPKTIRLDLQQMQKAQEIKVPETKT